MGIHYIVVDQTEDENNVMLTRVITNHFFPFLFFLLPFFMLFPPPISFLSYFLSIHIVVLLCNNGQFLFQLATPHSASSFSSSSPHCPSVLPYIFPHALPVGAIMHEQRQTDHCIYDYRSQGEAGDTYAWAHRLVSQSISTYYYYLFQSIYLLLLHAKAASPIHFVIRMLGVRTHAGTYTHAS